MGCNFRSFCPPDETNETTETQSASESFGESEQIAPEPETLGGTKPEPAESAIKDPSDWVTGDEPATGPRGADDTVERAQDPSALAGV